MRISTMAAALFLSACAEPMVEVMAATGDLAEGVTLTAEHLAPVKVARRLATPNTVRPETATTVLGKPTRVALSKGDLVLASYVTPHPALAELVSKRARSVTLSVSGADELHAGDHVDLLAAVRDPQAGDWVALTLAQNVIVLSPGAFEPKSEGEDFQLRRVSFLVLSEEAEVALLTVRLGALHVTLRNPDDLDVLEERGRATINTILSGERRRILEQRRINVLSRAEPPALPPPHPVDTAPVPTLPGREP